MPDDFEKKVIEECKHHNNIFIFVSKKDEVNTLPIIEFLLKQNKNIIVPVIRGKGLILSKIDTTFDLEPSTYGILEPTSIIPFEKRDIDIFFVPGTFFDKNRNRKGRGKGYFDRFLIDIKGKKPIVGLCKSSQYVDILQPKETDIPVDKVIIRIK
ncbi:MAG: 5-formyltetrahydrofolate cyclo-ligase [Candidatus Woesearchaeota archaeon]